MDELSHQPRFLTLGFDILPGTNGNEAEDSGSIEVENDVGGKQMDSYRRTRAYFIVDGQVVISVADALSGSLMLLPDRNCGDIPEYPKGEWLGMVRNMWKNKTKNNCDDAEMK